MAALKDDNEQLQQRLSGLAEQMDNGDQGDAQGHWGRATNENSRCGKSWQRMRQCWTGCGRRRGLDRHPAPAEAQYAMMLKA
jgi:hypothetical protein